MLTDRTTPAPPARIVAIPHAQLNGADDASQAHCLLARVLRAPSAVGEKPGRAGPLPFAVLLPNAAAQTRASQPPLGLRFHAVSGTVDGVLCSWSSCQCVVGCHYDQDEEPFHPISMVVLSRCAHDTWEHWKCRSSTAVRLFSVRAPVRDWCTTFPQLSHRAAGSADWTPTNRLRRGLEPDLLLLHPMNRKRILVVEDKSIISADLESRL